MPKKASAISMDMLSEMMNEFELDEPEQKAEVQPLSFMNQHLDQDYFYHEENTGENAGGGEEDVDAANEDAADDDDYEEGEEPSNQAERAVGERVSAFAGDEAALVEGQNNRMFYAIRNMNRSDQDFFLDVFEKYCYTHVPRLDFNRQNHPFVVLLQNHPHPKFLNIPLCLAVLSFYNGAKRTYEWNAEIYQKFKEVHTAHDLYRYIVLFNQYG